MSGLSVMMKMQVFSLPLALSQFQNPHVKWQDFASTWGHFRLHFKSCMAFQLVIKSNSFPCHSIFQTNLKKIESFEMEKCRADLQMLEKTLITG